MSFEVCFGSSRLSRKKYCRCLTSVDTLKRELIGTYAYKLQASLAEKVVVDGHG